VQDRGLAAYIAELVGTLLLTFAACTVVVLYVATSANAQTGSDFAVVGLAQAFVLFGLIITLGVASGGHFNPVVTLAAAILRRIDPVDAEVSSVRCWSRGFCSTRAGPATTARYRSVRS
jgi:glycerol uptake facilitator-like aquaporin